METYYGTKRIQASPYAGDPDTPAGYDVVYPDGYRSYSPKEVFDASYRKSGQMDFGHALTALKQGRVVSRAGWNGKGMHLTIQEPNGKTPETLPYISMFTACKNWVPWLASQTDMLAEDWCIVG